MTGLETVWAFVVVLTVVTTILKSAAAARLVRGDDGLKGERLSTWFSMTAAVVWRNRHTWAIIVLLHIFFVLNATMSAYFVETCGPNEGALDSDCVGELMDEAGPRILASLLLFTGIELHDVYNRIRMTAGRLRPVIRLIGWSTVLLIISHGLGV